MRFNDLVLVFIAAVTCNVTGAAAQEARRANPAAAQVVNGAAAASATLPPGYVIGAGDILSIVFWRDKDMSADVTVRPDGKISLPLLNEISAAGYAPGELRVKLTEAAEKFIEDPDVTVVVREIRSRNVFITGSVAKPGTFPLNSDMTVLQLIAVAGGLHEYADAKHIVVIRTENGRQQYHKFNYKDVVGQKYIAQNITLKPGDTVVVP
jgi:polysaccharide export outer membrane protein